MGHRNSEDAPKTCSREMVVRARNQFVGVVLSRHRHRPPHRASSVLTVKPKYASSFSWCSGSGREASRLFSDYELNHFYTVRVNRVDMNLCALTMRTHANVKDDRPFSGPIRSYVAPFKGLKGQRNTASVTYRSNFFPDDLDDPELAFDNNNTFRDVCITPTTTTTNLSIKIFGRCMCENILLVNWRDNLQCCHQFSPLSQL